MKKPDKQWERYLNMAMAALLMISVLWIGIFLLTEQQEMPVEPEIQETTIPTEIPTEPIEETEPMRVAWNLVLVNPWNRMPQDFTVELTEMENGHAIDSRAYPDFQEMMGDMKAEGLSPVVCSSYRTNEKQQTLFSNKVKTYLKKGYTLAEAEAEAGTQIAVPGTSEHQLGLALDIVDVSYPYLDEKQEKTATQKWLMQHSWEYGFILRYPSDKSEITGIIYEPWHYRYVGKGAAQQMVEQGLCLEEYLKEPANG